MKSPLRRTLAGLAVTTVALMGSGAHAQFDYLFGFTDTGNAADGNSQLVLNGGTIILDSRARGWFDTAQSNSLPNDNYIVGKFGTNEYRNFFLFDLAGITAPITSAQLRLLNVDGRYDTPGSYTYTNWDFTGDLNDLVSLNGNPGIFSDLGSGVQYGATDVSGATDGAILSFDLNANALSRINQGGQFVVGGTLNQGNLTAVPEPGEWAAMGILVAGLGGLVVRARRKRA